MNRASLTAIFCSKSLSSAAWAVILLSCTVNNAWSETLYKWVDQQGNISYQDRPPPSESAISQEILKAPPKAAPITDAPASAERNNPVVVYTMESCDACEILLLRLKQLAIPIQEQSILNRAVQSRILTLTDRVSAPSIFIGDKLLIDNSEKNLLNELKAAGYQLPESTSGNTDDQTDVQ